MKRGRTAPHKNRWRRRRRRRPTPGSAPGTISIDPEAPRPEIRLMRYGPDHFEELALPDADAIPSHLGKSAVTWINITGLGDEKTLRRLAELFHLHPLALEDVVNVSQRPKVETYGDHHFIVARMVSWTGHAETEQLSLFLGEGLVLTFQERAGDCLEPVRERIRKGSGRLRARGADYLTYALVDAVVDHYFPVLEGVGEELDLLEEEVLDSPEQHTMTRIRNIKRELLTIRRSVWPLRDVLNILVRDDMAHVHEDTRMYFRDVHDHTVQVVDLVENFRELGSGLIDAYMSSVSNRMNEVMKVLTVVASIFIPLTFIAGIYGMNFDSEASSLNMPELKWGLGYVFFWGLMVFIAGAQIVFFRRKGWIGGARRKEQATPPEARVKEPSPRAP